METRNRIKR